MNRRKTLLAMVGAWGAACFRPAFAKPSASNQTGSVTLAGSGSGAVADDAVEEALREDLARLGSRAYSDEGIPVFLACEDWVTEKAARPTAPASTLSRTVAADLRKNGEAWQRIYPNAPDTDVSKVIEVLADRDFNRAGMGEKL